MKETKLNASIVQLIYAKLLRAISRQVCTPPTSIAHKETQTLLYNHVFFMVNYENA